MLPAGLEPTISAGRRPQTYALDRAATGTAVSHVYFTKYTQNQTYFTKRHVSDQSADNIERVLKTSYTLSVKLTTLKYFDPEFLHEFGSLL